MHDSLKSVALDQERISFIVSKIEYAQFKNGRTNIKVCLPFSFSLKLARLFTCPYVSQCQKMQEWVKKSRVLSTLLQCKPEMVFFQVIFIIQMGYLDFLFR